MTKESSNRENRPKERNFFRTLSKKGDKICFFPSLLFWNGNEKSFNTNITKLQSVLPWCQTYNIQALSEVRRQNRWPLKGEKKVTHVGMFLFLFIKGLKLFYIIQNAIIFLTAWKVTVSEIRFSSSKNCAKWQKRKANFQYSRVTKEWIWNE